MESGSSTPSPSPSQSSDVRISSNPQQSQMQTPRTPIYKRWWFIALAAIVGLAAALGFGYWLKSATETRATLQEQQTCAAAAEKYVASNSNTAQSYGLMQQHYNPRTRVCALEASHIYGLPTVVDTVLLDAFEGRELGKLNEATKVCHVDMPDGKMKQCKDGVEFSGLADVYLADSEGKR